LHAVAQTQLRQDPSHVCVHGRPGDDQLVGDLGVGELSALHAAGKLLDADFEKAKRTLGG
jgi:hypothetical protein